MPRKRLLMRDEAVPASPSGTRQRRLEPDGGQADLEGGAAVWRVGGGDAATVAVDDPGDDREAEAGAVLAALAAALGAPEALEQRIGVPGRKARAVVADREAHRVLVTLDRDLDRRARRRVDERVAQQVGEHLAQLV